MPPHLSDTWLEQNGHHVRRVTFLQDLPKYPNFFNVCPHITDLTAYRIDLSGLVRTTISKLPLRRITADIDSFEVIETPKSWNQIHGLAELPQLTHFAFPEGPFIRHIRDEDSKPSKIAQEILRNCRRLKLVVLIRKDDDDWDQQDEANPSVLPFECDDPRMVAIQRSSDLWSGVPRERDAWVIAEEMVQRNLELSEGWSQSNAT
ncbi:hypothetical protein BDN72DRAFT_840318 [Pluteus cervinus]|uniref:Uncharacterized protein n=1 Tax=Pluteus cervinus TaxID=181527 RepID=A0ACD3AV62_9AGAR|nr:hypothetical protein BDN72DRAFT_840318 [Pluteus cervinus]